MVTYVHDTPVAGRDDQSNALRASGGRVVGPSGAAALLGIPRSTLNSKSRG